MTKYVVIPIKISLKHKKFANSGDLIDESQLNTSTHDLLSGGFIRLATEEEIDFANKSISEIDVVEDEVKTEEVNAELSEDCKDEDNEVILPVVSKKDEVKNSLKNK